MQHSSIVKLLKGVYLIAYLIAYHPKGYPNIKTSMAVKELPWCKPTKSITDKSEEEEGTLSSSETLSSTKSSPPPNPTQGVLTPNSELASILTNFPATDFSFGYGSGVFSQTASEQSSSSEAKASSAEAKADPAAPLPMLDLILSTSNSHEFHSQNLVNHPSHYSGLARLFGPSFITYIQRNTGAAVWFNPLCEVPISSTDNTSKTRVIKYGIVETSDLLADLKTWEHLYLAGRMHKPIGIISDNYSDEIREAYEGNLGFGLAAGLLTLNDEEGGNNNDAEKSKHLPLDELFTSITNLSYAGDPRMKVGGEDPNKVLKLVSSKGQHERFTKLYTPSLQQLHKKGLISYDSKSSAIEWDINCKTTRATLLSALPPKVSTLSSSNHSSLAINSAIATIVSKSARSQSVKGALTAGLVRSLVYARAKFIKGGVLS